MIKFLHRLLVGYVAKLNRRAIADGVPITVLAPHPKCGCQGGEHNPEQFQTALMPVGDWEGPMPHPHPQFRDKLQTMRRPIIYLCRCKFCGGLTNTAGWNYQDVAKKPEPSGA